MTQTTKDRTCTLCGGSGEGLTMPACPGCGGTGRLRRIELVVVIEQYGRQAELISDDYRVPEEAREFFDASLRTIITRDGFKKANEDGPVIYAEVRVDGEPFGWWQGSGWDWPEG